MVIKKSNLLDIEEIFKLYRIASDFQRSKQEVVVWSEFDRTMVVQEIDQKRQFKLLIDNTIACIWAITFSDPQIWGARNADTAIYIHRIATNPEFRGRNFVGSIVNWAKKYAALKQKRYIRLDTIGENNGLIRHYTTAGFDFLGMFELDNVDELPPHYKEGPACLFEIDILKRK
ncbi:GNAT family N-acetyltransferase [Maribacter confluentis]|uniref:GNAT family N-acetyltransferase n=1 Tax=Maribacter confluentis TaxID=1656093 RepID=A0ABT8RT71_9FLAO|nr:GNAT family N-acetyltransferase [Maribacter confluentis]MDO1514104.1 GNAT family N-acetyltransferase [Maribacter confluentis]